MTHASLHTSPTPVPPHRCPADYRMPHNVDESVAALLCSDCVSAASSTGRNAFALVPVELLDELLEAEDLPRAHRRVHADEVVQVVRRLRRPDARVGRGGLHPSAVRLQHVPGGMNTRAYGTSSLRCAQRWKKSFPAALAREKGGEKSLSRRRRSCKVAAEKSLGPGQKGGTQDGFEGR